MEELDNMRNRTPRYRALVCLPFLTVVTAGSVLAQPGGGVNSQRRLPQIVFNTDASRVLAVLARQANAGIVISEDVKGTVNLNLGGMTIDEAFRLVAAQAGLAFR